MPEPAWLLVLGGEGFSRILPEQGMPVLSGLGQVLYLLAGGLLVGLLSYLIWRLRSRTPVQPSDLAAMCQQLEATVRQQAERDRFLLAMAQRIRPSLDFQATLPTMVAEVRQFLQSDRVLLYQFHANWRGTVVVESTAVAALPILHHILHDAWLDAEWLMKFSQGQTWTIDDVAARQVSPLYQKALLNLQVQAHLIVPIVISKPLICLEGDTASSPPPDSSLWGLLIVHQCQAPRQWQTWEVTLLQQLAIQVGIAIQQNRLLAEAQQHAQRERTVNQVGQAIRNSLQLDVIFATATIEIANLLNADRCEIAQYCPERRGWRVVADYHAQPLEPNAVGREVADADHPLAAMIQRRDIACLEDASVSAAEVAPNQPDGIWLVVPLQVRETVWGTLSLLTPGCADWQLREVDLVYEVAAQLAIAIQQSELYQQVQQLNTRLEKLVNERTTQLQEMLNYEALLKRITDKVRDSLDESQILQTVVHELTLLSFVDACHAYLHPPTESDLPPQHYEFSEGMNSFHTSITEMAVLSPVPGQLAQGLAFQLCTIAPLSVNASVALLVCPVMDEGQAWGELWLVKPCEFCFDALEIRLVKQVANQCAIALRQSRLYQTAQAQVEELERLNRLKDDFLSTVSHELRTPMSSIKMATQMLELLLFPVAQSPLESLNWTAVSRVLAVRGLDKTQALETIAPHVNKLGHYFQILQDECDREIRLINDLLDLSRLDAGTEPLTLVTIAPQIWVAHLAEPFVERARLRQQVFQLMLPPELPLLTSDLACLERILTELLNNACKYTPAGETITLSAQVVAVPELTAAPAPSYLQLCVCNSGIEIPIAELPHVFDKFYRVPNTDPWKHGGTGLGLALVKKLVQHLNGRIEATSANHLTTFTLELPLDGDRASKPLPKAKL
jgi:GAF domain-containing protein